MYELGKNNASRASDALDAAMPIVHTPLRAGCAFLFFLFVLYLYEGERRIYRQDTKRRVFRSRKNPDHRRGLG